MADVAIFNQEHAVLPCQPPHHLVGLHHHNNQGASQRMTMTILFPTTPPLGMRHPLSPGCLSGEEANQSLSILLPSPGFQISQVLREEYN